MADAETLIQSVIDLLDVLVDLYLGSLVKPFLRFHDEFSSDMNKLLRSILDDNKDIIPDWLTGNASAYLRVFLVFPTILFLAWGQLVIPFLFVVMVDLLGLLGFVVAKFWVDAKRDHAEDVVREDDRPTSKSFTSSDDDSMDSYEFGELISGMNATYVFVVAPHFSTFSRGGNNWISSADEIMESNSSISIMRWVPGCGLR